MEDTSPLVYHVSILPASDESLHASDEANNKSEELSRITGIYDSHLNLGEFLNDLYVVSHQATVKYIESLIERQSVL